VLEWFLVGTASFSNCAHCRFLVPRNRQNSFNTHGLILPAWIPGAQHLRAGASPPDAQIPLDPVIRVVTAHFC